MSNATAAKAARTSFSIPSLDGIRACSFMLVFLAHVGVPGIPGGFGVTVFFFLSGYLITTLLRREAEATQRIDLKLFYLRRALRILPPFYLVLSLALALTMLGLLPGPFSTAGLLAQALHYSNFYVIAHGWDGLLAGTGVYWSLAVEEHFYLIFPALFGLMSKRRLAGKTQHTLLLGACLVVLAWRCWIVFGQGVVGDRTYIGSDTRFDSMLFGCALAVWGNPAIDVAPTERPSSLELLAAAGGGVLLLASFLLREQTFRESIRYSMQGLGLYPLFFLSIRHPTWSLMRFLNLRAVRYVGTLSYSLYLVHQVVLHIAWKLPAPDVVRAAVTLGVSLLLAVLSFRYVEKPFAKLRSRFSAVAHQT
ncbi:MAG TPA: acyltransferase [Polyangiaceae bacterium]|nr:acyltransferase [Polyangiaceae bacterium]